MGMVVNNSQARDDSDLGGSGAGSGIKRVISTFKMYFGDKIRTGFGNRLDERGRGGLLRRHLQ